MKLIFWYLQVDSINICHKNYLVELLLASNTQKLVDLHVFLFATWMDVTVNGNGKSFFFQIWLNQLRFKITFSFTYPYSSYQHTIKSK